VIKEVVRFSVRLYRQSLARSLLDQTSLSESKWALRLIAVLSSIVGHSVESVSTKTGGNLPSKIDRKILDAAGKVFAAHGYYGSTTKEIAIAADVTEGSGD
jgi:Bacterial regulatory proteins, tetR family